MSTISRYPQWYLNFNAGTERGRSQLVRPVSNSEKTERFSPGRKFKGKEPPRRPTCPFCGLPVDRPRDLQTRRPGEMPVGSCSCGAVYAYDATGHNLGAAFIEALVFACDMDWDLAWGLLPGEDYLEEPVEDYDYESHLIVPAGVYQGRKVAGALYFVRLHRDIREFTGSGVQEKLAASVPLSTGTAAAGQQETVSYTRQELEKMVAGYETEQLLALARGNKRIMRDLQRLLYSGDELLRLRAAEITGKACALIARDNPGSVSRFLQNLFSAAVSPGASGWGAIDAIGEIIRSSPGLFGGYLATLYQLLEDEELRPRALRAIGVIAEKYPHLVNKPVYFFLAYLNDARPETRGYAAWLLGNLGDGKAEEALRNMPAGDEKITFYTSGHLDEKTLAQVAREALTKLKSR